MPTSFIGQIDLGFNRRDVTVAFDLNDTDFLKRSLISETNSIQTILRCSTFQDTAFLLMAPTLLLPSISLSEPQKRLRKEMPLLSDKSSTFSWQPITG
jgi:hypothetical protein